MCPRPGVFTPTDPRTGPYGLQAPTEVMHEHSPPAAPGCSSAHRALSCRPCTRSLPSSLRRGKFSPPALSRAPRRARVPERLPPSSSGPSFFGVGLRRPTPPLSSAFYNSMFIVPVRELSNFICTKWLQLMKFVPGNLNTANVNTRR
jgi:hypothetical protein